MAEDHRNASLLHLPQLIGGRGRRRHRHNGQARYFLVDELQDDVALPVDAAPWPQLKTFNTVPALPSGAPEFVRFNNVPVVIEDVTSSNAVCVLSEPHCHV